MSKAQLGYLLLCDAHAKVGEKDCVLGIFNRILVRRFPTHHPQCYLAFELWADPGKHEMKIFVRNTDEEDVVDPMGPVEMQIGDSGQGSGAVQLRGLPLAKPGIYSFVVAIDDIEVGARDLFVEPAQGAQGAQGGGQAPTAS